MFQERCHDVLDLMQTIHQCRNLSRIEIGGTKVRGLEAGLMKQGKSLTITIRQIHSDFENSVGIFKASGYDVIDIEEKKFDEDFYQFRCSVNEMERRLAFLLFSFQTNTAGPL